MTKNNLFLGVNVGFISVNNRMALNIKSERDGSRDVVTFYSGPAAFNFNIRLATLTQEWCRSPDEKKTLVEEIRKHSPIEIPGLEKSIDGIAFAIQKIKDDPDNVPPEEELDSSESDPHVIVQEETNTTAIKVDRVEDIKMPKIDEIAPISFEGLPKYNLVCMLKEYVASYSDPYPEYCFQNGIAMLSTLTRRRLKMGINGREEFTNVWTLSLGQSGYARKGGMWKYQTMLKEAIGDTFLPHDATPEGLIDIMADRIETTAYDKKAGVQVKKVEFDSRDYPGKIRKAVCSLWKDEAGQFYAELNKTHKQSQKEFLCTLFDCTANYEKKLSGKYFIIRDTFYGMNLATTPAAFKEHCVGRDVHTGFIARHNIVSPTYKKKRKEITENKDEDTVIENGFVEMIKAIDKLIPKECLRVRIGQKNIDILEEWAARGEEFFRNRNDDMMGSFFARFQISVLKMAVLLELGNLPYYLTDYLLHREGSGLITSETVEINIGELNKSTPVDNNKIGELLQNHPLTTNYEISSISISTSTLLYVIDLFNKMYIPYTHKLCEDLIVSKKFSNVRDVEMIIKEKGLIDRRSLLKKSKMHTDELDKALDTLFTSETAIEYQVKRKTKPATWYLYNPSNYTTFDFSIANVDKIPREDYTIVLTKKKRKPSAVIEAYYICHHKPKQKIPCAHPAKCSTCNHYSSNKQESIMPNPG